MRWFRRRSPDYIDELYDLTLSGGSLILTVLRRSPKPLLPPASPHPPEPTGYAACRECGVLCKGCHTCAPEEEPVAIAPVAQVVAFGKKRGA